MPNLHCELIKKTQYKQSHWQGGTTTEIYISPKNTLYANRDFDFRISSAEVMLPESEFTSLDGYMRHIMLLSGEMKLEHKGFHTVTLDLFGQDYFDGSWQTKCYGVCTDFNLMLKQGFTGKLQAIKSDRKQILNNKKTTAFFSLQDHLSVLISHQDQQVISLEMGKKDFLIIHADKSGVQNEKEYELVLKQSEAEPSKNMSVKPMIRVDVWTETV